MLANQKICVKDVVTLNDGRKARVKYIGPTNFKPGTWYGLELTHGTGRNNGKIQNRTYFSCNGHKGIFVKLNRITDIIEKDCEMRERISIFDRVLVKSRYKGQVKYIGEMVGYLPNAKAKVIYYGVELDSTNGNCNGSLKGTSFFDCSLNCGIFVTCKQIRLLHNVNKKKKSNLSGSTKKLPTARTLVAKPITSNITQTKRSGRRKSLCKESQPKELNKQNDKSKSKSTSTSTSTSTLTKKKYHVGEIIQIMHMRQWQMAEIRIVNYKYDFIVCYLLTTRQQITIKRIKTSKKIRKHTPIDSEEPQLENKQPFIDEHGHKKLTNENESSTDIRLLPHPKVQRSGKKISQSNQLKDISKKKLNIESKGENRSKNVVISKSGRIKIQYDAPICTSSSSSSFNCSSQNSFETVKSNPRPPSLNLSTTSIAKEITPSPQNSNCSKNNGQHNIQSLARKNKKYKINTSRPKLTLKLKNNNNNNNNDSNKSSDDKTPLKIGNYSNATSPPKYESNKIASPITPRMSSSNTIIKQFSSNADPQRMKVKPKHRGRSYTETDIYSPQDTFSRKNKTPLPKSEEIKEEQFLDKINEDDIDRDILAKAKPSRRSRRRRTQSQSEAINLVRQLRKQQPPPRLDLFLARKSRKNELTQRPLPPAPQQWEITFTKKPLGFWIESEDPDTNTNAFVHRVDSSLAPQVPKGSLIVSINGQRVIGLHFTNILKQLLTCELPMTIVFQKLNIKALRIDLSKINQSVLPSPLHCYARDQELHEIEKGFQLSRSSTFRSLFY